MNGEIIPLFSESEPSFSKEQKTFNSRIKKIGKLRKKYAELEDLVVKIKSEYFSRIEPRLVEFQDTREELLGIAEGWVEQLKGKDKKNLKAVIEDLSFKLISEEGRESLIPIHDKYSQESYQQKLDQQNDYMKDIANSFMGDHLNINANFDDIDMRDVHKVFERMQDALEDKVGNQNEERSNLFQNSAPNKRKAKEEQEKQVVTKLCKSIYTKLVKAFHPDLEHDHEVREEKTQIMKELTTAYAKNDIHTLLKMQVKLNGNETEPINVCPDSQLRYLNKLLLEQIRELESMVFAITNPPPSLAGHGYLDYFKFGKKYLSKIKDDACEYLIVITTARAQNARLKSDIHCMKSYIKAYMKDMEERNMTSLFEELQFGNLF